MKEITPLESLEQTWLFQWASMQERKYPELMLMHHVPNGGLRQKGVAKKLKAEGVKPGVPDICLPISRQGYHGLYIELKRIGEKASQEQSKWMSMPEKQGYRAVVKEGWIEAAKELIDYLGMDIQL